MIKIAFTSLLLISLLQIAATGQGSRSPWRIEYSQDRTRAIVTTDLVQLTGRAGNKINIVFAVRYELGPVKKVPEEVAVTLFSSGAEYRYASDHRLILWLDGGSADLGRTRYTALRSGSKNGNSIW